VTGDDGDEPVVVALTGMPVELSTRLEEGLDAQLRELAYRLHGNGSADDDVPARVLAACHAAFVALSRHAAGTARRRDAAWAEGLEHVDLRLLLPPRVLPVVVRLRQALEDADAYCAAHDVLRGSVLPPDCRELRDWAFQEVVAQLTGGTSTSWHRRQGASA
jgi:hypothetical protein